MEKARGSWSIACAVLAAGLGACGGKGTANAESEKSVSPATSGNSGASTGGGGASFGGGGASFGGGTSIGGGSSGTGGPLCLAACIPSANLTVRGLAADYAFTHSFEACRNSECYRGGPFQPDQDTNLMLAGSFGSWDATNVMLSYFSPPETSTSAELLLMWNLPAWSEELTDGDRYALRATSGAGDVSTLIEKAVSYESYSVCDRSAPGSCKEVHVDADASK